GPTGPEPRSRAPGTDQPLRRLDAVDDALLPGHCKLRGWDLLRERLLHRFLAAAQDRSKRLDAIGLRHVVHVCYLLFLEIEETPGIDLVAAARPIARDDERMH